jgi:hypothetical protein
MVSGAARIRNRTAIGRQHDPRMSYNLRSATMTNAIDRFIWAIETASLGGTGVFAPDAILDATVPHWRYTVRGAANIEAELGRWYADPGRFEEMRRTALPEGELVEFVLTWEEDGEPHMAHQAHVIEVRDGLVTRDRAWCGGRWGAALQAEMAEAARL